MRQPAPSPPAAPDPSKFTGRTALAPITLAGYSTQDISLDSVLRELGQPIPYGSIRIQYSGAPGSVMAEVSSVEHSKDLVVDAKIQNEGNGWAGSGANPWHLDNETDSYIFLTNMSDKTARIGFKIWASSSVYYLTKLRLSARETRVISLRRLRDAQQPDFKRNKIPAGATDGSVEWNRLDNLPVMGRVAVVERHGGVASSYDCSTCQCPANAIALLVDPNLAELTDPGLTYQVASTETTQNCNGQLFYAGETDSSTWSSTYTSVATVSSTALVTAVATGSTDINASYSDCRQWAWSPDRGCICQNDQGVTGYGQTNVQVPGFVVYNNPQKITNFPCPGTAKQVPALQISWIAEDTSKKPIANAAVAETIWFTAQGSCKPSQGCSGPPKASTWTTGSNGVITAPDTIVNCSSTCTSTGSCTETWRQTFEVNSTSVQIINGSTIGTQNCWTATCGDTPTGSTQ